MKKLLALLCVIAMLCSCCVVAFAEESDIDEHGCQVITYEDASEDLYDGVWAVFDELFAMYMPSEWLCMDITDMDEEDVEEGYVLYAYPDDEDSEAIMIICYYTPEEIEVSSLEELYEIVAEDNEACEIVNVNGIHVIFALDEEEDYAALFCLTENGYVFEIAYSGLAEDDYAACFENMLCTFIADPDMIEQVNDDEAAVFPILVEAE